MTLLYQVYERRLKLDERSKFAKKFITLFFLYVFPLCFSLYVFCTDKRRKFCPVIISVIQIALN